MKNPLKLFLQLNPDNEDIEKLEYKELHGVTHSIEKINNNDVEYDLHNPLNLIAIDLKERLPEYGKEIYILFNYMLETILEPSTYYGNPCFITNSGKECTFDKVICFYEVQRKKYS